MVMVVISGNGGTSGNDGTSGNGGISGNGGTRDKKCFFEVFC